MFLTPSATADGLIVAIVALIGGHALYLRSKGEWLVFDPLNAFWAGVLVCYVEQPIAHAATFIAWHDKALLNRTLFWILFGLVWVVAGYQIQVGRRLVRLVPGLPARLHEHKLWAAALVLMALGFLGYAYDTQQAGGAAAWLSVARGGSDLQKVSSYVLQLEGLLPVGVGLGLFIVELFRGPRVLRGAAWVAGGLMWLWFIYLGSRSRTIWFALVILAACFMPRRRNPPLLLLAVVMLGLFLLSNFQGAFRGHFRNLSFNLGELELSEILTGSLPGWLGGGQKVVLEEPSGGIEFNCVMSVIKLVPEMVPYNYGYGHLEVFTRPIPRSVWLEKPYPHLESVQGVLAQADLSRSRGGFSELLAGPAFTFIGHWYYVGGVLGLALGGLVTGILFRVIRGIYDRNPDSLGGLLVYLQLIIIGFGDAAGTPFYWVFSLPFTLLPLLLAIYFCRAPAGEAPGVIEREHSARQMRGTGGRARVPL